MAGLFLEDRDGNVNKHSGVNANESGTDYIITRFEKQYYLYSTKITGLEYVKQMKELAILGEGLSSFSSRNIRKRCLTAKIN